MTAFSSSRLWMPYLVGAFWFALLLWGLLGLLVVRHLPVGMISAVVGAGVVLGAGFFVLRWLFARRAAGYSAFGSFLVCGLAGILLAVGGASFPIYALAFWVQSGPTAVPLVTLSNGAKTVVFQGMQHVASESFYKSVVFDLENALADGYTLFYEGIQPVPERPDLTVWFNRTLRGTDTDLSEGYTQMAKQCDLTFQLDYFRPLLSDQATHPERHVTADVTYLEMKTEYDRLLKEDAAFAAAVAARADPPADLPAKTSEKGIFERLWLTQTEESSEKKDRLSELLEAVRGSTPEQQKLIGILCRGVLGMVISGQLGDPDNPTNRLILDFRNQELARFVAESPAEKIYITYGAAHFPGFFAELQQRDPAFQIVSIKGIRPMTLPDEAQLPLSILSGLTH